MNLIQQFTDIISNNSIISTAWVLSLSGTVIYMLKDIPMKIYRFIRLRVVKSIVINNTEHVRHYELFSELFAEKYSKQIRHYEFSLKESIFLPKDSFFYLFHNGFPIYVVIRYKENEHAQYKHDKYEKIITMYSFNKKILHSYIKKMNDLVLDKIESESNKSLYILDSYNDWMKFKDLQNYDINNYFYNNDLGNYIIKDIEFFILNKNWYEKRNLYYKRGYLLHGAPGNGKTSLIIALANYFKLNVYLFNNSNFTSDEGFIRSINVLNNCDKGKLKFLVFEDFDTMNTNIKRNEVDVEEEYESDIKEDNNNRRLNDHTIVRNFTEMMNDVTTYNELTKIMRGVPLKIKKEKSNNKQNKSTGVSFSTLLNFFDGNYSLNNVLVFFTTNFIEDFDKALLRSGRIDKKYELENPNIETVKKYFDNFFETSLDISNFELQKDFCMADVQGLCMESFSSKEEAISKLFKQKQINGKQ